MKKKHDSYDEKDEFDVSDLMGWLPEEPVFTKNDRPNRKQTKRKRDMNRKDREYDDWN